MRKQWTTKGNRDAVSSCLCDRGLHRYLRNFRGGFENPKPPFSVRHWPFPLSHHLTTLSITETTCFTKTGLLNEILFKYLALESSGRHF